MPVQVYMPARSLGTHNVAWQDLIMEHVPSTVATSRRRTPLQNAEHLSASWDKRTLLPSKHSSEEELFFNNCGWMNWQTQATYVQRACFD